ncbi:MAG: hypothetical protein WCV99_24015, partial [Sterolibacterium sp.]
MKDNPSLAPLVRKLGVSNVSKVPTKATPAQKVQLNGTAPNHNDHFHVYIRPPQDVPITTTRNLMTDNANWRQTEAPENDVMRVAAQEMLDQAQPYFNFSQGDLIMFVPDMPDVPPQFAPVMIAQASQAKQGSAKIDRTVGVCQAFSNPFGSSIADALTSAEYSLSPVGDVKNYFRIVEKRTVKGSSSVTVLESPQHGKLEDMGTLVWDADTGVKTDTGERNYRYIPEPGYLGQDSAILQVAIGGFKVKMVYSFKVATAVDYKNEKELCPKPYWKISSTLDANGNNTLIAVDYLPSLTCDSTSVSDTTALDASLGSNYLSSQVTNTSGATLSFADLPGGALGQTSNQSITLDDNAAGYNWFID